MQESAATPPMQSIPFRILTCCSFLGGRAPLSFAVAAAAASRGAQADAVSKRHSTVSEAVALALGAMRAHRCVLTHFSQRYPELPDLPQNVSARVLVACDLLSVTLGQLAWAPAAALPVLRCLFSPDDDAAEAAAEAAAEISAGAAAGVTALRAMPKTL